MRILVTGSRDLEDFQLVWDTLADLLLKHQRTFTVVHGACLTGADYHARLWCRHMNHSVSLVQEEPYPAEDFGPWPACGPKRNSHMVSTNPDICLGFFKHGAKNKGTTDCVVKAVQAGIPVRTFWSE